MNSEPAGPRERSIGLATGTLFVIANMVGVGIFINTGVIARLVPTGPGVLATWVFGGVIALCGALCYAELGAALPHNGGEYQFLVRAYHPLAGFLCGWVSVLAGFGAPLALVARAFGAHLNAVFPSIPTVPAAAGLIVLCAVIHSLHVQGGHVFQNVSTALKVGLILTFIAFGLSLSRFELIGMSQARSLPQQLLSAGFAQSVIEVFFAYAGWNAAAYVAGEYRRPERDLPLSLILGTAIVTVLYLVVNVVFLTSVPLTELTKERDGISTLGHTVATALMGETGGVVMSLLIVLTLISSGGAFLMAGSRMLEAMGERHPGLRMLRARRAGGGPVVAILVQSALAIGLLVSLQSAGLLLMWVGLTLSICTVLAVLAVFVLRIREPNLPRPYRTWGYPITPLVFLALQTWVIVWTLRMNPWATVASAGLLAVGCVLYVIVGTTPATEAAAVVTSEGVAGLATPHLMREEDGQEAVIDGR